ncbi:MAG TPA: TolC family protein [Dissulfurispiraceae bacterium]|nr:TolC family protein [Dissulfurispiraceae bacterium]
MNRINIAIVFLMIAVLAFLPVAGWSQEQSTTLTLADGLKAVTDENRVLRIAYFNRDLASKDVALARSKFFPVINASADYTMLAHQPGAVFGQLSMPTANKDYPSYTLAVHQTLFDFWARESLYSASQESMELTKTDILRTKNLVALDFVNAYFNLLESGRMIEVGQHEVDALKSHYEMARNLFDAGVITKNDLLQAEVRLSDAQQRLLILKNQKIFNASRINNILSRPLTADVFPAETSEDLLPMQVLDKSWDAALQQRPEIQMTDRQIKINELQETAKRSDFLPAFFAEGGYNFTRNQYQLHEDNWSLVFGLTINLFNGGATKAQLSKIRIRTEQLREERNKLLDDIRLEVQRYHLDESSARDNVATTKDAIKQAEENLRINKVRYEEGVGTATDVLDAISLLTVAEKNFYKALYDMRRAHAGLLYATGEDLTLAYK